ncbi:response regulator [Halorussus halophilus]|uniref:response regulator n=1 Tax=Halorussus halophilus TaxID=2650975 RepID=UPI00130157EC|nr:response regulator [Halorussus halophilus]
MLDAPPRVLHVEDNDFFASVTSGILDDEYGIRVHTVESATDALGLLEDEQFDCVVSDYEMPGMNGLELLGTVRDEYSNLPFILLTGGGSEQIASKAISTGVTDYLKKGTGKEQFTVLANRIENAVARRRTEQLSLRQTEVNDLVWDVSQAVLQESSREDIEHTVCSRIGSSEAYALAWVGKVDGETVRPKSHCVSKDAEFEPIALDDGKKPVSVAVETGEVQVGSTPILDVDVAIDDESCREAIVPLASESDPVGVLGICSEARHAFGETERRVLSKFGNSVAYAIESVRTRKELVRREQRLQVFNRILRHNLRNDLNVVLGYADELHDEVPDAKPEADIIRKKASDLIEISEKAREVGKTLDGDDRTKRQIDVTNCVERTCAEFRQTYPDAEIRSNLPDAAPVYADKTLEAAIGEVLENAIEHNDDERPTVELAISADDGDHSTDHGWFELTIADDGPGIPQEERAVLLEGEETALHHGSGLGLWLTNWIVGKFGGELTFEESRNDGSVVRIRLQRAQNV